MLVCVCFVYKVVFSQFTSLYPLDEYDAFIVVSFTNATLVLSIGETVEEVTDSGFLGTTPTLACSRLGDDALIQASTHLLASTVVYHIISDAFWVCAIFSHHNVSLFLAALIYLKLLLSVTSGEVSDI